MHQIQSERQKFFESCKAADDFPRNLVFPATWEYTLREYAEQLNDRKTKLFREEGRESFLDVLQYDSPKTGFRMRRIESIENLRGLFNESFQFKEFDPRCRYVFMHAPSSRDKLRVSREMLVFVLTYHQVLPSFLDFIFCFQRTQYARDFHFSGFRWADRMSMAESGLRIPELGRSGRDIQLCYSLKSAERSNDKKWPWSVRQTAVYHSFDVETGTATWIIVKGNQLMKGRFESAIRTPELSSLASNSSAFAASLSAHVFFCDWCIEGWRWYIDYLEEAVQGRTRRTLSLEVSTPTTERAFQDPELSSKRQGFETTNYHPPGVFLPSTSTQTKRLQPLVRPPHHLKASAYHELPNEVSQSPVTELQPGQDTFSFGTLQEMQYVEEKVNDIILVVTANINVLAELKQEYGNVLNSEDCPQDLKRDCGGNVLRFGKRVSRVTCDLLVVRSRAETLLKSIADRKELLYGILQFRNMEANSLLARKSKISADHMEKMTGEMHQIAKETKDMTANMNDLAQDTKRETVSMRIITLVTLFFLPGTFISTIMSTSIIQFSSTENGGPGKMFLPSALKLYLELTLPLMVFTFVTWYGMYKWESSRHPKIRGRGQKGSA